MLTCSVWVPVDAGQVTGAGEAGQGTEAGVDGGNQETGGGDDAAKHEDGKANASSENTAGFDFLPEPEQCGVDGDNGSSESSLVAQLDADRHRCDAVAAAQHSQRLTRAQHRKTRPGSFANDSVPQVPGDFCKQEVGSPALSRLCHCFHPLTCGAC